MEHPPLPPDEDERLLALHALQILDSEPEERFDRITRTAARLFDVPIAVLSLVDEERVWFKSSQGLAVDQLPRNDSICTHAILEEEILVVEDATADPRFADNPLVTAQDGLRFYAGCPVRDGRGRTLGMLCILDRRPRGFSEEDRRSIEDLGRWVERELFLLDGGQALEADGPDDAELLRSAAGYRDLCENASDLLMVVSPEGRLLYANRTSREVLGLDVDQEADLESLIAPEHAETARRRFEQLLAGEEIQALETVFRNRHGEAFPVEGRVNCYRQGNEVAFVRCVFRDISKRREVERMKSEFVSTVSHELRTPLTSIKASLGLLLGGTSGDLTPETTSLLQIAHKNCSRLVLLLNDILDMEKIEAGRMEYHLEPSCLSELVESCREEVQALVHRFEIELQVQDDTGGAMVYADPGRLQQVLSNLLSNACKFSPEGGEVRIRASRIGEEVLVEVMDQGPGIPEDAREKIFQKFGQVDASDARSREGTGLGLSIAEAIVERHGGRIGVRTREEEGSVFWFTLPTLSEFPEISADGDDWRRRILVCEDDADVARLLAEILHREGFETDLAPDGATALKCLAERRYAGMTLDLLLPDEDGLTLLRKIRDRDATRDLPVVVVSVQADEGHRQVHGNALGVVDWIPKPVDRARLREALQRAAHLGRSTRPRILHLESDAETHALLEEALGGEADVQLATSLEEARDLLERLSPDLIVLALDLPGEESSLQLLENLKGEPPPLVVLTAGEPGEDTARRVAALLVSPEDRARDLSEILRNLVRRCRGDAPEETAA